MRQVFHLSVAILDLVALVAYGAARLVPRRRGGGVDGPRGSRPER